MPYQNVKQANTPVNNSLGPSSDHKHLLVSALVGLQLPHQFFKRSLRFNQGISRVNVDQDSIFILRFINLILRDMPWHISVYKTILEETPWRVSAV
jgi:hypothetical protein